MILQTFRSKRGGGYESTGVATQTEIRELRRLAADLFSRLKTHIRNHHPALDPTRP
jgi:hypothetical protein